MKFSAITATYLCLASFATMSQAANLRKSRAATIAEEESRNLSVIAAGGRITLPEEDRKLFTRNEQDDALESEILVSFEQRVIETYQRMGLYQEGDDIEIDYSNFVLFNEGFGTKSSNIEDGPSAEVRTFTYENDSDSDKRFMLRTLKPIKRGVVAKVDRGFVLGENDVFEAFYGDNFAFSLSTLEETSMTYNQMIDNMSNIQVPAKTRVEGSIRAPTEIKTTEFRRTFRLSAYPDLDNQSVKVTIKDRSTGKNSQHEMSLHDTLRVDEDDFFRPDSNPYRGVVVTTLGQVRAEKPAFEGKRILVEVRHYDLNTDELVKVESLTTDEEGAVLDHKELPAPVQIV